MNQFFIVEPKLQSKLINFLRAATWPAIAALLMLVAYLHAISLVEWSVKSPFDFDAKAYYIPYAKRLLTEGMGFLFTEDAIHIPPFSFIFPALFGADIGVQKNVSIALSTLNIFLLFRTGQLLHSRLAGLTAVIFYALSPSLKPFLSTGSVEPLFIFLMAAWLWLLAEGWPSQRRWIFLSAGAFFGLAALTRATVMYFLPVIIIGAYWMQRRTKARDVRDIRENWANVAWAHGLALAMVLPVLIKNMVMFGLPSVSTGAGIALYLGNHPLTYGMDAGYFRTNFDNQFIPPAGLAHLALASDRALSAVGKYMLFSQSPSFIAEMYAQKLFAFFFVGNREWVGPVATLRGWRIFLIAFSIPALWTLRGRPVIWILAAVLGYQIVAHIPVLYSHRYSVGALEMALVLLAGVGVATFLQERRWRDLFALLLITTALIYAGRVYARDPHVLKTNIYGAPHDVIYTSKRGGLLIAGITGAKRVSESESKSDSGSEFESTEKTAIIDIDLTRLENVHRYTIQLITIEGSVKSSSPSGRCNPVSYFYRKQSESAYSAANVWQDNWAANGELATYVLGNEIPLEIYEPGTLRLQFTCDAKAHINLSRVEVVRPTVALYYREQYLKSIGAKDWRDVPFMRLSDKK